MKPSVLALLALAYSAHLSWSAPDMENPFESLESGAPSSVPFFQIAEPDGYKIPAYQRRLNSFLKGIRIVPCSAPSGYSFSDGKWFEGSFNGSPSFYLWVTERQRHSWTIVEGTIIWKETPSEDQENLVRAFGKALQDLHEK